MIDLPILNEDPTGRPFGDCGPQRVRVTIPVGGDETIDVIAYPTDTPGLVVNRAVEPNGDEWAVTHVVTGRALPQDFDSLEVARRCAKALNGVADWTLPRFTAQDVQATRDALRTFQATVCPSCDGSGEAWQPFIQCGDCEDGTRSVDEGVEALNGGATP